jgi:copper chaperone
MTCGGCSGAVTRVLEKAKADGGEHYTLLRLTMTHFELVSDFTVDLDTQEVIVKGIMPYDEVLARIKKTGKEVSTIDTLEKSS